MIHNMVNSSCEETGRHKYVWIAADNSSQFWICTQCGKEVGEFEDSQP